MPAALHFCLLVDFIAREGEEEGCGGDDGTTKHWPIQRRQVDGIDWSQGGKR